MFGKKIKIETEIVNGVCPVCNQDSLLISIVKNAFRCTMCGYDLEQRINGKISYIPALQKGDKVEFHGPEKVQ
jgi:uncharacterized protein (DUF983 family)